MTIEATFELDTISYPMVAAEIAVPINATTKIGDVWEDMGHEIDGAFFGREDLTDAHWDAIDVAIDFEKTEAAATGRAVKYVLDSEWLDGADSEAERETFYDDFEETHGYEPETPYAYFNVIFTNETE